MSYEPTNWKTGDVVTSAKLNKLENGVAGAGGALAVHANDNTLDKTWQEIYDALAGGKYVFLLDVDGEMVSQRRFISTSFDDRHGGYTVETETEQQYISDSSDGYPSITGE